MATIKASCPTCGDVDLTSADVRVRVCDNDNSGTYLFSCPVCTLTVVKPAQANVIDLLTNAGCSRTAWHLPRELTEPHCTLPTFTTDDYFDLHELLQRDDCFELLTVRPEDRQ